MSQLVNFFSAFSNLQRETRPGHPLSQARPNPPTGITCWSSQQSLFVSAHLAEGWGRKTRLPSEGAMRHQVGFYQGRTLLRGAEGTRPKDGVQSLLPDMPRGAVGEALRLLARAEKQAPSSSLLASPHAPASGCLVTTAWVLARQPGRAKLAGQRSPEEDVDLWEPFPFLPALWTLVLLGRHPP